LLATQYEEMEPQNLKPQPQSNHKMAVVFLVLEIYMLLHISASLQTVQPAINTSNYVNARELPKHFIKHTQKHVCGKCQDSCIHLTTAGHIKEWKKK